MKVEESPKFEFNDSFLFPLNPGLMVLCVDYPGKQAQLSCVDFSPNSGLSLMLVG